MNQSLEEDPEFQKLIKSVDFPAIDVIVIFAKKKGVDTPQKLWEVFDHIRRRWQEKKSCEGSGELC